MRGLRGWRVGSWWVSGRRVLVGTVGARGRREWGRGERFSSRVRRLLSRRTIRSLLRLSRSSNSSSLDLLSRTSSLLRLL